VNFLNFAFKLLSYRPRTEQEIVFRLKRKKATPSEIKKTLQTLKKLKFINDSDFVSWWQKYRDNHRPRSARILKYELTKKGISSDIIEKTLDTSPKKELSRAQKAYEKYTRTHKFDKQKAIGYLSRRGFSWATIKDLLD